ncbi:chitinase-like protein PB1E7.04c isoform X2 [Anopheles merus]|nr:chitinase-like protein PB1E7.04c isoform X2 [Anopheles merus]XP_041771922.1 chitinase-like protein PB1E7.04c isoform X2 [Anopheles merus]XP_041772032.1 chitinase-like protein PB1E7.04c isoform X2 [Anopheles merus]XP_041772033.1 chitinase-like protein PB1E7.04c isoform X2 [Anopheles merus]
MPSSSAKPGQRSSSGTSLLTVPSSSPPICDVSGSMPSSSAKPGQRSSSGRSLLTASSPPSTIPDVSGTFLFDGSLSDSSAIPGQRFTSDSSAMPGQRFSSGSSSSTSLPSLPDTFSSSGVHECVITRKQVDNLIKLSKQTTARNYVLRNGYYSRDNITQCSHYCH